MYVSHMLWGKNRRPYMAHTVFWIMLNLWIAASQDTINIGALFENDYMELGDVMRLAVEKINSRQDILPNTRLTYDIQHCPPHDSFTADRIVCQQLNDGVSAVFGPMTPCLANHVQSVCDAMEVPHVTTHWSDGDNSGHFTINLHPEGTNLSQAFLDLIEYSNWESFAILYDSDDGFSKLQGILSSPHASKYSISVRKLNTLEDGELRAILEEVRKDGKTRIILDVDYSHVQYILNQASAMNMMTNEYRYLLTTLDADLIDVGVFQHTGVHISAFRLIDPASPEVTQFLEEWKARGDSLGNSLVETEMGYGFRTEAALVYDAVHLFAKALDYLTSAVQIETASLSCTSADTWDRGMSLLNYMMMSSVEGVTGSVFVDSWGRRNQFSLEVIELSESRMEKIGSWDTKTGLSITTQHTMETVGRPEINMDTERDKRDVGLSSNATLIVTSILAPPYMMLRDESNLDGPLVGNDRYEGYCADLLKRVADIAGFNYEIRLVADGRYGSSDVNGQWNGMVRELMDRDADLAVASLTITSVREQVIDFSRPFISTGIGMLLKKPVRPPASLFRFLTPFSVEIWVFIIIMYFGVSLILFVVARLNPYEWYNPRRCGSDSDVVENQFTLKNSLWFTMGSLMQQGSDVIPRAVSTRIISSMWWFFTLVMISTYTANLAAIRISGELRPAHAEIQSVDDLARQTKIKYGTILGGSTSNFFRTSKVAIYESMWQFMSTSSPSVFVNSEQEGVDRVNQGDYAFFLESTTIDYMVQRQCQLMKVGGNLDSKGYGIATPMGSPYRNLISNAILAMREDGILHRLHKKWWTDRGVCYVSDEPFGLIGATIVNMKEVSGVFIMLLAGLALAVLVGVIECVCKASKTAKRNKQPFGAAMAEQMSCASRFRSSSRPAKKRQDAADMDTL